MCGMILIFAVSMSLMISRAEKVIDFMKEDQPAAGNEAPEAFITHPAD